MRRPAWAGGCRQTVIQKRLVKTTCPEAAAVSPPKAVTVGPPKAVAVGPPKAVAVGGQDTIWESLGEARKGRAQRIDIGIVKNGGVVGIKKRGRSSTRNTSGRARWRASQTGVHMVGRICSGRRREVQAILHQIIVLECCQTSQTVVTVVIVSAISLETANTGATRWPPGVGARLAAERHAQASASLWGQVPSTW